MASQAIQKCCSTKRFISNKCKNFYRSKVDQLHRGLSVLLLSSFLPTLFLSSESRMWIDFHWSNINISWRDRERRARLEELEGKKEKSRKMEVEHPFLTKREMCSRDELDSSRFHHNAPTGSLPNRPTTIVLLLFFLYIHIYFYKANKSRVYPLKKSTVKQLQTYTRYRVTWYVLTKM